MGNPQLFAMLVLHLTLTALPGAAAVLLAARLGVRSVPVLLAIGMAATGVLAMLAFWAYYGDRTLGETVSYLTLFGSIALVVGCLHGGRIERGLLRQLATPLGLWALGSAFLLFFGFLYGGSDDSIKVAAARFSGPLPTDNLLPAYLVEYFYEYGHSGHPLFPPDWLASDRPPLQVGYLLGQKPFEIIDDEANYQVASVVLQQLWIVGLWALLLAARVRKVTRGLVMATVLVSDLALLNGFFVWPKLLPAAMLLAAAALTVTPLWKELRGSSWAAVLIGALLGVALMGHGSSVFGVIPLAIVAAWRGMPSWRWLGIAALVGIVVVAPWSAYQKWGEPPGNRLLKWSLAGVPEIDDRGTVETIVDSYREVGVGGAIHNKGENFVTMVGGGPAWEAVQRADDDLRSGDLEGAVREVRLIFFFNLFPSLGLLLIAPFAMLAARRRLRGPPQEQDWSFALTCFAVVGIGCLGWGLLAFGDLASRTWLHVGSYLLPIIAFAGCVAGLRAVFPRFTVYYAAVAATLMMALYVPYLEPPPPPVQTAFSLWAALLAALFLAGFGAVAFSALGAPEAPGFDPDQGDDRQRAGDDGGDRGGVDQREATPHH
jgi:hypothetical protein